MHSRPLGVCISSMVLFAHICSPFNKFVDGKVVFCSVTQRQHKTKERNKVRVG